MGVDSGALLKELGQVWRGLGKQDESGVLRACAMTLLVVTTDDEDAQQLGETLAELMHEHPSRFIVLRVRTQTSDEVEGRVLVQCWMPFGRRQQICCEQIELVASRDRLTDMRAVILGLAVADLPVTLWCRELDLLRAAEVQPLLRLAQRVIVDGAAADSAAAVVAALSGLGGRQVVADLAWTRITRWRETLHGIFSGGCAPAQWSAARSAVVRHAGADVPASPLYLAAWLADTLPAGTEVRLEAEADAPSGAGLGTIRGVCIRGEGLEVELVRPDTVNVDVRVNGKEWRVLFPLLDENNLLREELALFGRDRVFERALGTAARLRGAA